MSKEVIWSKIILETFVEEALLTKEEEMIIRTRVAGWTRTKQALELNISVANVDKIIARLKLKYDEVQKYNLILPPRKNSEAEDYMDKN